ncbi:MAG: DUF262 domain-containing protein [Muricauda sp.]|nr:DUF262 domain-containing protein [Allomuricauda sp.]MBA4745953.1 DUF262 domain-containing protein [Allomuricauda sp.]
MNKQENQIILKTITELLGLHFYIPDYQRGYRWTNHNVSQLLNDIWEYRHDPAKVNTFYCLQPIVVRKKTWLSESGDTIDGYELIDGQQRLTTIHRILTYLRIEHLRIDKFSDEYQEDIYTIEYQTRPETRQFLNQTEGNLTKPDLYYLSKAYDTIKDWFENSGKIEGRSDKNNFLDTLLPSVKKDEAGNTIMPEWSTQIIWYEINGNTQKSEELFTRLNRGKIPLNSAELIKAKFVNQESFKEFGAQEKVKRRTQLIQLWDEIENHLNNPKFWAFISNKKMDSYSSKIEYLFDINTQKKDNSKDSLYSFIHFFDEKENADSLWEKWLSIEEIYRSLSYWHTHKNYYHKVGYLIAIGTNIMDIIQLKKENNKDLFEKEINLLIAESIPNDWDDLSYDNRNDHKKLIEILLLVNTELTRKNNNNNDFFPFEIYKNINKSLEHIHAQNIIGINENKREQWFSWLDMHLNVLLSITTNSKKANEIIEKANAIDREKYTYAQFQDLSASIIEILPKDDEDENLYLHNIKNLALLGLTENISLSNSIFEIKRRKIIEMDKQGAFIPIATKRVFLNYYQKESYSRSSIWSKIERENHLEEISECLNHYLNKTPVLNEA